MNHYPDISLLITHYNRSQSLYRLLKQLKNLEISFGQIVVSDDNSKKEHKDKIRSFQSEFDFDFISFEKNKGLGNNINKGQDLVNNPYTLYIQEDFVPKPAFKQILQQAHEAMINDSSLDVVRFYAYHKYPYLKPYNEFFKLMNFNFLSPGYKKFYLYSDHPHLKRSSFATKFGRYQEGLNPEKTEYHMMLSFIQRNGQALFFENHKGLFDHGNTEDEPSTMNRGWRRSNNLLITIIREIYRHGKFNLNYLFKRY